MKPAGIIATIVAALILSSSMAGAQPTKPGLAPSSPSVSLTLEQRHVIRELIKDLKVERSAVDSKLSPGDGVPQGVEPRALPPLVGQKVPQIKSHRFFVTSQQIVIVEPKQPRVAEVID
ncbi:MAG: hypothetical protein ACRECO_16130 [Xanthobacteraceae bacterium]